MTRTPVRARGILERMFVQDGAQHYYARPQRRRGWGRVIVLAAALLVATGRLAYGSGPVPTERVVVAAGDIATHSVVTDSWTPASAGSAQLVFSTPGYAVTPQSFSCKA